MKEKYKNIKTVLRKASYDFNAFEEKKGFEVKVDDKIIINEINDESINFEAIRDVKFNKKLIITIDYSCNLYTSEPVNKDAFIKDLRSGIGLLTEPYSYISLMISNMTALSPFDAFVTPPVYNEEKITIE